MPASELTSVAGIRKELAAAGLEVFRSKGDEIALAERPRENLIMDSGVVLRVGNLWKSASRSSSTRSTFRTTIRSACSNMRDARQVLRCPRDSSR